MDRARLAGWGFLTLAVALLVLGLFVPAITSTREEAFAVAWVLLCAAALLLIPATVFMVIWRRSR